MLKKRGCSIVGSAVVVLLLVVTPAVAQDTHYWTEQFGNRAYLLSGAVVGDPADLSAVYYNPGSLSLHESKEFLLAGLGIEFTSLKVKDAVAGGEDLSKTTSRFVPSLIAGEIPLQRENHRFAYSILTRHRNELRAFSKVDLPGDFFHLPAVSLVSDSLSLQTELNEYWVGGTWSWRARPNFGVGVSTFFAVRNQRSTTDGLLQVLTTDNYAAVFEASSGYKYKDWRLIWKIGAAGQVAKWNVGVTVTTRGLGLYGSGDVNSNKTIVGQVVDDGGSPLTFIATDIQHNLEAEYRSPFSIAGGASRALGNTVIHLSVEWFESIGLYKVVEANPFPAQSTGEMIDPSIHQALDSVLNFGVGTEHTLDSGLRMYAGFHTDFSGASRDPAANLTLSKWDLYHVSGGVTFDFRGQDITLGADIGFASDTVQSDPDDIFRPVTLPDEAEVQFSRITVILGFNFSF